MDIFECGDQWISDWSELQTDPPLTDFVNDDSGCYDTQIEIDDEYGQHNIANQTVNNFQPVDEQLFQIQSTTSSDWMFYLENCQFEISNFTEYYPEMKMEPLDFGSSSMTDDLQPCEDQNQPHHVHHDENLLSRLLKVELESDKGSSDCSESDEIPTPLLDKDGKITRMNSLSICGQNNSVPSPSPLSNLIMPSEHNSSSQSVQEILQSVKGVFDDISVGIKNESDCNSARSLESNGSIATGSALTPGFATGFSPISPFKSVEALLAETERINAKRGFNNLQEHRWFPSDFNCSFKMPPSYKPIWARPCDSRNPALFIAVLKDGDVVSGMELDELNGQFDGPKRAQKGRGKAKKRRPCLKSWDPIEVFYPIGYIPFSKWFHMSELRDEQMYSFDTEQFKSRPLADQHITYARQEDPDMNSNKYDSFYHRQGQGQDRGQMNLIGQNQNQVANDRECYCGCCQTWHKRDQCNWLHHMKSAHGIRSCTKQRYALPHIMSERPDKKEASGMFIGFCDQCQSWQNVNNSTGPSNNYASWFLHQASHDVQRNKDEGRTGKKRSKKDMKELLQVISAQEGEQRQLTKYSIRQVIQEDLEVNGDQNQFNTRYFSRTENYTYTKESQDIDGGI